MTTTWELWRQDDNGNEFLVERFESEEAARESLARYESLQHKQTYWVRESREAPPGSQSGKVE